MTIKGELSKGVTLYGYDGVDKFGHVHSITFTRQRELIGTCSVCKFVDAPDKGDKCKRCGGQVSSPIKVTRDHFAENAQRYNLLPPRRRLGSAVAEVVE